MSHLVTVLWDRFGLLLDIATERRIHASVGLHLRMYFAWHATN